MNKQLIYLASILSSLILLIACSSDDNINVPDLLGDVQGHISSSEGPIRDAYIKLNDQTTFSDNNGYFEFKNCLKQESAIRIEHPEFEEYIDTVTVTGAIVLNINLNRTHYDYFPLKVGNEWQYHWVSSGYASPNVSWYNPGKIDWEVVEKSGNYPFWIYRVKETYYDSTSSTTEENYFEIKALDNDSILFIGTNKLLWGSIRRYFPTNYSDTVYVFSPPYTRIYKRNTGLIHYSGNYGGITYGWSKSAKLIDYNLY